MLFLIVPPRFLTGAAQVKNDLISRLGTANQLMNPKLHYTTSLRECGARFPGAGACAPAARANENYCSIRGCPAATRSDPGRNPWPPVRPCRAGETALLPSPGRPEAGWLPW